MISTIYLRNSCISRLFSLLKILLRIHLKKTETKSNSNKTKTKEIIKSFALIVTHNTREDKSNLKKNPHTIKN